MARTRSGALLAELHAHTTWSDASCRSRAVQAGAALVAAHPFDDERVHPAR